MASQVMQVIATLTAALRRNVYRRICANTFHAISGDGAYLSSDVIN